MQYRRTCTPGGCYFFTVVTEGRRPVFDNEKTVGLLREAFRIVKMNRWFRIDAIVVLPDHLHCIWTLPPDDADFATRWRLIKTWFTKHCSSELRDGTNPVRVRKGEQAVWQRRYWEHIIRDEEDFRGHVDYIHYNPVKHGYVKSPVDWQYSSFRRYVVRGILPQNWGGVEMSFPENVGNE